MSDANENLPAGEGDSVEQLVLTDAQKALIKDVKTIQSVEQVYFSPAQIADAVVLINHINAIGVTPVYNGACFTDPENNPFPDTHGILVQPIGETVKDKDGNNVRQTKTVIVAAVPTLDTLLYTTEGKDYVERGVLGAIAGKLRNSIVRAEDMSSVTLPFSVTDFIERSEKGAADQGLQSFKTIGPKLVKALANNKINVNLALLRQILSSTKFAESLLPNVKQTVWVKTLEAAIAEANKLKLATTIFEKWKSDRDTVSVDIAVDDIDFNMG